MKPIGILIIAIAGVFSSCVNEKYVYKSNTVYKNSTTFSASSPPVASYDLTVKKPSTGFKANITDKGDYLLIKPSGTPAFTDAIISLTVPHTGSRAEHQGKLYFPELDFDPQTPLPRKFTYFDTKPVLQALSVPLKIRPRLNNMAVADSFPSQTETGLNFGLAFGWKLNHNIYKADKGIFGQNTNRISFAFGGFCGAGAVDLKKSNTRNPAISFERKAVSISPGWFFMLGFNNINIGYAIGRDFATGTNSEQWLYQGHTWHGIIVALDILK